MRSQRHSRIGADRMPAIAIFRRAPEGGAAMAANPDRWMRFLHRLRQAAHALELIELARKVGWILCPQRLEDLQIFIAERAAPLKGWGMQRLKLFAQPADADTVRQPRPHREIDGHHPCT